MMEVADEAAQLDRERVVKTDRDALKEMVRLGGMKEIEFKDQEKTRKNFARLLRHMDQKHGEEGPGRPGEADRRILEKTFARGGLVTEPKIRNRICEQCGYHRSKSIGGRSGTHRMIGVVTEMHST